MSRQVATRLGELGHEVELLSSTPLCLSRFTRHVRRVHPVPVFGREPLARRAWARAPRGPRRARHEQADHVPGGDHERVGELALLGRC
jgi:hypothetical protein